MTKEMTTLFPATIDDLAELVNTSCCLYTTPLARDPNGDIAIVREYIARSSQFTWETVALSDLVDGDIFAPQVQCMGMTRGGDFIWYTRICVVRGSGYKQLFVTAARELTEGVDEVSRGASSVNVWQLVIEARPELLQTLSRLPALTALRCPHACRVGEGEAEAEDPR